MYRYIDTSTGKAGIDLDIDIDIGNVRDVMKLCFMSTVQRKKDDRPGQDGHR